MHNARRLKEFARILRRHHKDFRFTMLEVGAARYEDRKEPFYPLLDAFPGSRIIGFEVDPATCDAMNKAAPEGVHYYPVALGRANETRPFHVTEHPACCSLYRPNAALIGLYQEMQYATLRHVTQIETQSLDHFVQTQGIGTADFIKIDIQGAELDVFQGGGTTLAGVAAIVSEVEFLPHYLDQPLFGDVCAHLAGLGLMFHKFVTMSSRSLRPMVLNNDAASGPQDLWADAMFVRHVQAIDSLPPVQTAKLAILAYLYGSIDLTFFCLSSHDRQAGTTLHAAFRQAL